MPCSRKVLVTCSVSHRRAYYHCGVCHRGHCPFDGANDLHADRLSAGLRPLVCLAGVLESFANGAEDILRRFAGVRLSAATVRRVTEEAGAILARRQQQGDIVVPCKPQAWDFTIEAITRA